MSLRSFGGWFLFAIALVPWFLSLIVQPYDTMGTLPRNIRPSVAESILYCTIASVLLFGLSGLLLFTDKNARRGWKRHAAFAVVFFFFTTSLARALWMKFYVLAQLP